MFFKMRLFEVRITQYHNCMDFFRRIFISTKKSTKKSYTYNTKHTIYKKKEIKANNETGNIKRRKKNKWG